MHRNCFVMMPFDDSGRALYEDVLEGAIREAGLVPKIGDSYEAGSIPDQILRDIRGAAVAVAVLTGKNANVFYEMGLAHQSGIPTIALLEAEPKAVPNELPFDIRHQRVIAYRLTDAGKDELRTILKAALPKLENERLLGQMLAPSSVTCDQAVISAAPLAYRDARRKIGGASRFRATFSDQVGIRGLLRALAIVRGFDGLPELWNPNDFLDVVLTGDERSKPSPMTIYAIGSPKSNRFTGLLMKKFFEAARPRFSFVPDVRSQDLRDVALELRKDEQAFIEGLGPEDSNRKLRDIGLVIRGANPYHPAGMMLILAGRSALGTEAACRSVVEPEGVRQILRYLEPHAESCYKCSASSALLDYSKAFWATVTMRAEAGGDRAPNSLQVGSAGYFGSS